MTGAAPLPTPGIGRRLACFLYEGVLLFGVVMVAGVVYATVVGQHDALVGTRGLQVVLFIVLGAYFVVFWSRSGQTLAMQTWHIRLLGRDGEPPRPLRALCRYVLAWLWFVPALLALQASGLKGWLPTVSALVAGVLGYAALTRLHPERQLWHDAVCATRLVTWRRPGERVRS